MLAGRHIVLGVSGGVAAYKAAYLTRRLLEQGADVRVVLTPGASEFIGAQTFSALTKHHTMTSLFSGPSVSPHTEWGQWADLMIVAPATVHTLSKIAYGISGDALSATVLATRAPLLVAPAMHTEMWEHPATVEILRRLTSAGHSVVGPVEGELAGGDVGTGRMAEPDEIVEAAAGVLSLKPLAGRSVVVTAGGTREPIDPVRYIGNRSSGKMGHAIATAAARLGARVVLVTSSTLPAPFGVEVVRVETAEEMATAAWSAARDADAVVLAAAVADFRPKSVADRKLRRIDGAPDMVLEPTPNILAGVAGMDPRPFLVGFAAQTGSLEDAGRKATTYGVDLLVANDVSAAGSGFGTNTNQVTVFHPDGTADGWPLLTKAEVAERLVELIAARLEVAHQA